MSWFDHITGNDQAKSYLLRMTEKKAIAQSLLFAGPDGVGKSLFAEAFAKLLLCSDDPQGTHKRKFESGSHPDIRIYKPEGKIGMHSIESLRSFNEEVYMPPFEAQWKVFIIHEAERMLTYSANALLKTFEEPAPQSIIILLSSKPEALLSTILSRCRTLRFHTLSEDNIIQLLMEKGKKSADEAKMIAVLAQGSAGNAFRLLERQGDKLRAQVLNLLSLGKISTYTQVIQAAKEISEQVESSKQQVEESMREALTNLYPDGATSVQQHAIEKEVEGAIAMRLAQEAHAIFDLVLTWYRDMQLLLTGGNTKYLLHRDYQTRVEDAVQRGDILSIETVQKGVAHARLALERSTPLSHCLENLFLILLR